MGYDPQKQTWYNPSIEYLFNDEIIEYDMRDAGFNLIKEYHLLSSEKINELEKMGKGLERHIAVGKLQRDDKEFSAALTNKFAEMRYNFISANTISDSDIVSVKKDALFIIGNVYHTKFGNVEFAQKNTYSSYIRFSDVNNLEIYYHNNDMDIKGMSDISVNKHRLYMIDFLQKVIPMIESKDVRIKRFMMKFINDYKSQNLDEGYYLEFNNLSNNINPMFNYQKIIIPIMQIISRELVI